MSDFTLDQVARNTSEWLRGEGPLHEIVISSRIRLARNVAGRRFLSRADTDERDDVAEIVSTAVRKSSRLSGYIQIDVAALDDLHRRLLVERRLISRQHAEASGARRVAFAGDETSAVMINEEDHLRIQVIRSGFRLDEAWDEINKIDDELESQLEFAFHPQYGYLTACPTNVGTGLRVSVMLHLPALRLTSELDKVVEAAKELRLAIRGLYGEGSDATGDFFQISNQITLGKSESEIIDDFRDQVIPRIVEFERAARTALIDRRAIALDDKIFRAMGALRTARLMSSNEALQCLSHVRMGLHTGRLREIDLTTLNELLLHTQPAHLQVLSEGRSLNGQERSELRAAMIRRRLGISEN